MLLGCLIALLAAAGAAAVFTLEEVHTLRDALNQNAPLDLSAGSLASAGWGDPQTLLLVGNDQRKHTTTTAVLPHSNEMLLVRLDPNKPWISMMSVPRELMVTIHTPGGRVTTRLNAALTYGGIPLLVKTIQRLTGLPVNHVVEIDFNNFVKAVDNIGCVYSTVDRRYYHVNVPGGPQYQEINLEPGYQRLCGLRALQFVSYRHGDTSLVRDSRDQDFLLDVKKQYGPTLVGDAHKFERIFGRTVQTDVGLHGTNGLLNLLGTLVSSVSKPVRQVKFQVTLQPTGANPCSCDTATPKQVRASVHSFLYGAGKPSKAATAAVAHSVHSRRTIKRLPLTAVSHSQLGRAHAVARTVPFPFEYPRVQNKSGSDVAPYLLSYVIKAPGGARYPAYVASFSAGVLGQYYDVQGSPWTTQPQLDNPDQTVTVGARRYYLYYSGQHLRMVAWYDRGNAYWVHNSLSDSVGNGELLAIAQQTVPISRSDVLAARARVSLRAARVPIRLSTTSSPTLHQTIGAIAGLVAAILLFPLLAFLLFRRRRDLRQVRESVTATLSSSVRFATPTAMSALASPSGAGRAPGAPVTTDRGAGGRRGIRGRLSRGPRPSVILGAVLVLLAGAALGLALTFAGSHVVHDSSSAKHKHGHRVTAGGLTVPSVPVVVLNATPVSDAAHRLSATLRSKGVRIDSVGNLAGTRPPGLAVLYRPGERLQAERLAALLVRQRPTLAPVDPEAAGAAGSRAKLVVVIG
ncbi:MAG: LCP family protein [Solirubrobacteraceae bacterium]